MKLFKHLRDNRGDENVSKLIWVVIVFVVGAILLTTIFSAFKTPISGWYDNLVDSWFGEPAPEQRYSLGDDEVQSPYELTNEGMGATFLINGEPVDCYAAYNLSQTEDDDVYAYFIGEYYSLDMYVIGTGKMMDIEDEDVDIGYRYLNTDLHPYAVKSVDIEDGITYIGASSFRVFNSLVSASLPNTITSIGDYAFAGCNYLVLTSLPEDITSIGEGAFQSCPKIALTSLPENITSIEIRAFAGTNLALTSLPEGITSIGDYAFAGCDNLALTSLPEGVTSIGEGAFRSCDSLAITTLPEGVTVINDDTFAFCYSLPYDFEIPQTVTSIGTLAFDHLPSIIYHGTATDNAPWGALELNGEPTGYGEGEE